MTTKTTFRDKLIELTSKNDKKSDILKRIFEKNYADESEEYEVKKNVFIQSKKNDSFSGYFKKIK